MVMEKGPAVSLPSVDDVKHEDGTTSAPSPEQEDEHQHPPAPKAAPKAAPKPGQPLHDCVQAQVRACSQDGDDAGGQDQGHGHAAQQQAQAASVNLIAQYRNRLGSCKQQDAPVEPVPREAPDSGGLPKPEVSFEEIQDEISLALTSIHSGMMYSEASLPRLAPSVDNMMQRKFDEGDPFQVLDESLLVLGEIELLIKDSLDLPPDTPLGQQGEGVLAQVPAALLDALQETISVILESRSEIDEIMSVSSASSIRGRTPPSGSRHRGSPVFSPTARHPHLSPYLQHLNPGGASTGRQHSAGGGRAAWQLNSSHISIAASSPKRPYSAQPHRMEALNPVSSPAHSPVRWQPPSPQSRPAATRAQHSSPQVSKQHRQLPGSNNSPGSPSLHDRGMMNNQLEQVSPEVPDKARLHGGRLGGDTPPSLDGGVSAVSRGSSGTGDYLYKRVQAQRLEQEEQQRHRALEEHRRRRQALHSSSPAADFMASQNARQAEAERKRIAQMRSDLQFIQQLRDKQAMLEQHHSQTIEQAQQAVTELRSMKAKTDVTRKWLAYQHVLTQPAGP